jgi:6,7-dimethyl-8-ribityllumazine synthase
MENQADEKNIDVTTVNGATELEAQVQCRLSGQIRDFRLVVAGEGLVLRGHAHTYHAKQLAQHAVMEATNLPIQANEIEVS